MSRRRNWCFTWNNPTLDADSVSVLLEPACKYAVFQLEKGEEETPHFQGYVEWNNTKTLSACKKMINAAVHWEPRKGSQEQARIYCMKEDTRVAGPYEVGEYKPNKPGKRNDIIEFKNQILSGKRTRDLLEDHSLMMAKYPKFYYTVQQCRDNYHIEDREVIVLCGDPGTGKTYDARTENPDAWIQYNENGTIWFDGYDGQEVAILDDFAGKMSKMSLTMLLRMLHDWTEWMPIKGSFAFWEPKKIIITTNIHPKKWYDYEDRDQSWEALKRRITKFIVYYKQHDNVVKEESSLDD